MLVSSLLAVNTSLGNRKTEEDSNTVLCLFITRRQRVATKPILRGSFPHVLFNNLIVMGASIQHRDITLENQ